MINVYIGWDSKQDLAYQVCKHSIVSRNKNVNIVPIKQSLLRDQGVYTRKEDSLSSTEFSFTRFLVPYLSGYKGWSLFCDLDIIFLDNIETLFSLTNDQYAVMCVKHDYQVKEGFKMDNQIQSVYPRKNWSSLVLFNCNHKSNQTLTPNLVNTESGKFLHGFNWLADNEIGEIDKEWNWLVGVYKEPKDGKPKAIHYTEGGPWFDNYKNCEYSDTWLEELKNYQLTLSS